jgi:hypothetical protein
VGEEREEEEEEEEKKRSAIVTHSPRCLSTSESIGKSSSSLIFQKILHVYSQFGAVWEI